MKRRLLSFVLVAIVILSLSSRSANAANDHVYYSQTGWTDKMGNSLSNMCYFTSFAMLVTNMGKTITPVDAYYANGSMSCDFNLISGYYGLNCEHPSVSLKDKYGSDETKKREVIADLLKTGNYPAGILVCGVTSGIAHMVVARKVVDGVIYCDDPAKGCCIPIGETSRVSSYITGYWIFTKNEKWNTAGIGGSSNSGSSTPGLSVTSSTSGIWKVTIPANYKLLCYSTNTATKSSTYISAKSAAYTLSCTKQALLSNGKSRYFFVSGDNKELWIDVTSSMKVEAILSSSNTSKAYTLTFNANRGSVSQSSKSVTSGSSYGTLPTPIRDGYIFDGWYTSASGGSKVTSSTTFNGSSDITLYAHWTAVPTAKNIKITFNANGGSTSQSSKIITAGSYLTDLPTATRNGYTFLGWTTDKIAPNSSVTQTTVVISENMFSFDKDTTLYAYWRKNEAPSYTVSFSANGGSVSQSSKSVISGSSYGTLPTPTRSGYTFDGWYTSVSGGSKITSSTTFNESSNITLYAHWTAVPAEKTVKITFNANGGSTSQRSKTIAAGSYLTGLPTATRNGCTFLGWALDKIDPNASGTYSTTVVSEGTFSFDKDTTLYAYWRPDKPTTPEICTHTKGKLQYSDRPHPHYNYYSCSKCGETYTDYSTSTDTSCESCWGPWSGWSTTPVYTSSTRQVETRSVQISAGATEYRYGRYIDSTGGHICWCSTYLGSKGYSGITVQYSSWSTTRYGANGKVWTCGNCTGSHTGIDHYDSQGRPAWKEYSLSSGSYYWEESRQTSATYETQYRYRDLIS